MTFRKTERDIRSILQVEPEQAVVVQRQHVFGISTTIIVLTVGMNNALHDEIRNFLIFRTEDARHPQYLHTITLHEDRSATSAGIYGFLAGSVLR